MNNGGRFPLHAQKPNYTSQFKTGRMQNRQFHRHCTDFSSLCTYTTLMKLVPCCQRSLHYKFSLLALFGVAVLKNKKLQELTFWNSLVHESCRNMKLSISKLVTNSVSYGYEYEEKEDITMKLIVAIATLSKRDSWMVMISLQPFVSHLHDLSIFILDNPFFFLWRNNVCTPGHMEGTRMWHPPFQKTELLRMRRRMRSLLP